MSNNSSHIDASRIRISLEDCLEREDWLMGLLSILTGEFKIRKQEEIGSLSHNICIIESHTPRLV